jgi:long-chain acyl-CoA synthetase
VFYYRSDEETAHMEKIVVSNRYRRKGISESLMNELFNRLKADNTKYVTTGFFRPEYFYQFGFKIERKYSGLVKEL